MKITVYKCDLCKHLFVPTEEPVLIRGSERDICPSCLDQLVKRFETDETAAVEETEAEPVKVEPAKVEEPEPEPVKPDELIAKVEKDIEAVKTEKESAKEAEAAKKKREEKMKIRSTSAEKFYECFRKGMNRAETAKKLGVAYNAANYYWGLWKKKEKEN